MAYKKSSKRGDGRDKSGGVRAIRIPIKKSKKISSEDLEDAIERKLRSRKGDIFGDDDTIVLVLEKFGK
jgi:hypothetical protein